MRKLIASLLASVGVVSAAQPQPKVQTVDPKTILFTTPTLSNDIADLVAVNREPGNDDFVFHEDEWSQVEFFPKEQLSEVQRLLNEYKKFEQAHRVKHGWREVYVRKIQRVPVVSGPHPVRQLEQLLGSRAGAAPMLFSSSTISGSVKNGFSLPLGGNVTLYGYTDGQKIPVLGAIVGRNPDDSRLTQAFLKLSSSKGLILVDWRSQLVLVSVASSGNIEVWRP
ncbi:MAG: hypothetical protein KF892_24180 [Rhizobacter sp.]|nr:hypothetical protein [Rhizobacter sp.]